MRSVLRAALFFVAGWLSFVSVAPVQAQAWRAQWIGPSTRAVSDWTVYRKHFTLSARPNRAPTRIAADTKYWLYVNDTLVVFEGGLKGGPQRTGIYFDTLDLAPYLQAGQNTIAVLVWRLTRDGYSHLVRGGATDALLFEMDVGNGVLISDRSWRALPHPGYGESGAGPQPNFRLPEPNVEFDARLASGIAGWNTSTFDDSAWPDAQERGQVGAQAAGLMRARPTPLLAFSPIKAYEWVTYTLDRDVAVIHAQLPSNLQITPYLVVDAPAGAVIEMQTDYYRDGNAPNVRALYTTRAGIQEYESFGWMSGTAVIYRVPRTVRVLRIGYRETGYATRFAGAFASNDPFLDSLWGKAARTVYVNMRDTYMDCPTRERAQWWADVANEIRAGAYVFDGSANHLAAKGIRELVAWRRPTGEIFSPIPAAGWGPELPQQMLAAIWGAWRYYLASGDSSWVDESYFVFADHVARWPTERNGLVGHRYGEWDWSDWGSDIDARLLENAWYALAVRAVADMARIRGDAVEVKRWEARYAALHDAFEQLWDGSAQAYRFPGFRGAPDDRGNALAVVAGLVPASRVDAMVRLLRSRMTASPYMEFYALEALYLLRAPDAALDRMATRYAPQVTGPEAGPTLWEFWSPGEGSRDHGWNSGPLYALSAHVAGVRPLVAGFSHFLVDAQLGRLARVQADVPTPFGAIRVEARSGRDRWVLHVEAPSGTTARIALPWDGTGSERVVANGVEIFAAGRATGGLPDRVEYAGEDSHSLYFDLDAGTWDIDVSRVTPPGRPQPSPRPLSRRPP